MLEVRLEAKDDSISGSHDQHVTMALHLTQVFSTTSAPIPGPPGRYINKDLQQATKLALEFFVKG